MSDYKSFFPDPATESAVLAVLDTYREKKSEQGDLHDLPPVIQTGLAEPAARYIYDHRAVFCEDYYFMESAAELDCVTVFKLWMEASRERIQEKPPLVNYYTGVACNKNAVQSIRYMMMQCADINHRYPYDDAGPIFYDAVKEGHALAVRTLMEHPAIDINLGSNAGVSPLSYALNHHRAEVAAILMEAGVPLMDDDIIKVCQNVNKESIDVLVKYLKDPDAILSKKGITPLHAAIAAGASYTVRKLLEIGAKTDVPSRKQYKKEGKTYASKLSAMDYAEIQGNTWIQDYLANRPDKRVSPILNYVLQSPLEEYRQFFPDEASELTLIEALTDYRETRLNQELMDSLPEEIAIGLQYPDPRYVYDHLEIFCHHYVTLVYAAQHDCVPLFRLRFEKLKTTEFVFDEETYQTEDFINSACFHDAGNVIRYLVPYAKNINHRDSQGMTCLHWASQHAKLNAMAALLEHPDIDIELEDTDGVTPLVRAFYSDRAAAPDLLLKAGAKLTVGTVIDILKSFRYGSVEVIGRHIKDVDEMDPALGITPLHAAVMVNNLKGVEKLVELGAKTNILSLKACTERGRTYPAGMNAIQYTDVEVDEGSKHLNKQIKRILAR